MPHLVRDGVKLYYEEKGDGPPMVFVHGWTCALEHVAPQAEHYAPAHRCVSVDLRGHGRSDAPEQEYTVEGFADDVAWLCGEIGVTRAVIAGHSMGGAIALALAASRPDLCAALIMLDPAILSPGGVAQLAAGLRSPQGRAIQRGFGANALFLATSDPALKERLLEEMARTPMHVVASAFEGIGAFDAEAALRAVRSPALSIGAEPGIASPDRLRELCPAIVTERTVGVGHFHQLEAPEQVNAMMDRFLAAHALI